MKKRKVIRTIYISTYIPQKCGIATFTKDVTSAINLINPNALAEIMAIVKKDEDIEFPWEVKYKIDRDSRESYVRAANYINKSGCDIVLIEHEFGIFGGECGSYLLDFLKAIKKPKVMTCHTLIEDPNNEWGKLFTQLVKYVDGLAVMTNFSAKKLSKLYNFDRRSIAVIPHGTPDIAFGATSVYRKKKKLEGRLILGNINLLSEQKGIDFSIEAVAKIAKKYPEVLYLVIGQTHPNILKRDGEKYRNSLKKKIKKLGIEKNVKFINKYVSIEELVEWLKTIDIYITPYLDQQQSSSGALAYAVGAGKICISTKYLYANELLAKGRGIFVQFRDSGAIAKTVIKLWGDENRKKQLKEKAYNYGRFMTWPSVALQHLDFFAETIKKHANKNRKTN
jgi:glycosyltransferase involved in cell wall biosynthesis